MKKIVKGKDGKLYYGKGTQGGLAPQPPTKVKGATKTLTPTPTLSTISPSLNSQKFTKLQQEMFNYLQQTNAAQSPTTQATLRILVGRKNGIHRCCLTTELREQGVESAQVASQIRDLRNAGVNIPIQKKSICPIHDKNATLDQIFTPYITGDSYARAKYSANEIAAIRNILGREDAFTKRPTSNIEIDHRIPVARMRVSELLAEDKVDVNDAEAVKTRYQPLTRDNNLYKSRVCEKCVETNTKPNVFLGIPVPKKIGGGEEFDASKNNCSTCPYAYPEKFLSKVRYNG